MPNGYLVSLGANQQLGAGDALASSLTNGFSTDRILGPGQITYRYGIFNTNATALGNYVLGTDGNVYFVPTQTMQNNPETLAVGPNPTPPAFGNQTGTAGNDAALTGTAGDDVIYGGTSRTAAENAASGSDTINAGAGNDTVHAGDGNDSVLGGDGDDMIHAGSGADTVAGGAGNDRVFGGADADSVTGGDGDDYLDGGAGNDTLSGDGGADTLLGGAGDDTLDGGIGNDRLFGGSGADSIQGGDGNDTIIGGTANGTIVNGSFTGNTAGWNVTGPDASIDIEYNPEGTYLNNGSTNGVVEMDGNAGQTTVLKQAFDVTEPGMTTVAFRTGLRPGAPAAGGKLNIDGFRVEVVDAGGNVIFTQTIMPQTVAPAWTTYSFDVGLPASGRYTLRFTEVGDNDSYGALLDDVSLTNGADGADMLAGGAGDDTIHGQTGADTLSGDAGSDVLFGGADNDTLSGGTGNDTLSGGTGSDRFIVAVGDGTDTVTGGEDADNAEVDTLTLEGAAGVTVTYSGNEAGTAIFAGTAGTTTFSQIERVVTTAQADTIDGRLATGGIDVDAGAGNDSVTGGAGADTLLGGAGADTLSGGAGADSIAGGDGDDVVRGGTGADRLDGGAGSDTLDYGDSTLGVTVDLLANTATGGDATGDTIANFENVTGSAAADAVTLSNTAGTVTAGGGNDTVTGGAGNDAITGGAGDDRILGGAGNDTLQGDAGSDSLTGGTGDDSITGGDGGDTVSGGAGADRMDGGAGIDTLDYSDSASGVTVDLLLNTATGGDATGDTIANFENVTGSAGNDQLLLSDTAGTVLAGAGDDVALGGAGADALFGGAGNDMLDGGAGNDTLSGGAGSDQFTGGAGDDLIDMGAADGSTDLVMVQSGDGRDIVTGFEAPVSDGTGRFAGRDQIDATALRDAQGRPVNVRDVVVGDDGTGNAVLTFPGGESLTIMGITPAQANNPFFLNAMGIPLPDGTVTGTSGDDTIAAGYTDDDGDRVDANDAILTGSSGDDDVIAAGAGNDTVRAGAGTDRVFGGTGNDSLSGGAGNDTLSGDAGNDTLTGGTGNDSLDGGDGDDTFVIGSGDGTDSVSGGEGAQTTGDTLDASGMTANTTLDLTGPERGTLTAGLGNGTAADDTTVSFAEIERFFLGSGNDTATGGDGDDTVDMGAGDDVFRLFNGFGDDRITGGTGAEVAGDTLDAGAVTANLTVTLTGPGAGSLTDGTDTLTFDQFEGVVTGTGNDRVTGSTGADRITTGAGADTIDGGAGNDRIDAGAGDDSMAGGAGSDSISAGAGADTIDGGAGDDRIDLGAADGIADTVVLRDGSGDDVVLSFAGPTANPDGSYTPQDRLDVSDLRDAQGQPVNVADVTVTDDGNGHAVLGFPNGESIVLTGISPVAAAAPAYLAALGIPPTDGTVSGTAGDDLIQLGYTDADGDRVDGGDAAAAGAGPDDDLVRAGDGNDTVRAGAGNDVVMGDAGDDSLSGGDGSDTLIGGLGHDTLSGDAGNDTLRGDAGNDVLDGGAGADTLFGGDGNDILSVGLGDIADGGTANDDFILPASAQGPVGRITVAGGDGFDRLIIDRSQIASGLPDFKANPSASGTLTLLNGTTVDFTSIEGIICFTPGTRIATPMGARDIATLHVGDLVMTRDHGLQPIRWIQSRTVRAEGRFAPIRIRPGVLTGQDSDLLVSPQHRMLFQGYRAELLFGETEVLVAATHLVDGAQVTQEDGGHVTYIHMMFDSHEIVFAEGAATESFHPGAIGLDAVHDRAREELFAVFPELRADLTHYGDTARRCLKRHEAELLRL